MKRCAPQDSDEGLLVMADPQFFDRLQSQPNRLEMNTEAGSIANTSARQLVISTTLLQEQLIACCCKEEPAPSMADLTVTKEAPVEVTLPPGGIVNFNYKIVVTNLGASAAENVKVVDTLLSTVEAVIFDSTIWTEKLAKKEYEASLSTLSVTESKTLMLGVRVNKEGNYNNRVTVSSTTPDPNPANNSATVSTYVRQEQSEDIGIRKAAQNEITLTPGQSAEIVYTVKIINLGPSVAENVMVEDTLPPGVQEVVFAAPWTEEERNKRYVANLGNLLVNDPRQLELTAKA